VNEARIAEIRECLRSAFSPTELEIVDESYLHAGHAGARDGRGHFRVSLTSDRFLDVPTLQRHRMVYAALGSLMETDIHALSVTAHAPHSDETSR
jgi:BolA protein